MIGDPIAQRAILERMLVLVEPRPASQRLLRRAWRSAQRLGADIDALWAHRPGASLPMTSAWRSLRCAGWRRCSACISSRRRIPT